MLLTFAVWFSMVRSTHPERPKRISCIFEKHREWGLLARCLQLEVWNTLIITTVIVTIINDSSTNDDSNVNDSIPLQMSIEIMRAAATLMMTTLTTRMTVKLNDHNAGFER